ncbi:MAG: sigma-70 family RNA polymerase sigma factor [Candidatus Poribacteria bacterium]|nr:sigma-70 family RNA polymerase sigma factor [Candidatus Poribacteria bacterium]
MEERKLNLTFRDHFTYVRMYIHPGGVAVTHKPTDQELVIRLKAGDLTALAVLDRRYRVRLIRQIVPLARSYEEAEDMYQEAILKAVSHIESFDPRRSFCNWLHRIAQNQCIDEYRRNRGMPTVADDELLLKLAGNDRDALDQVTNRELEEQIQHAIDGLPKRQRAVAKLRLLEGLEYKEIARRIGGNVQAVKSLFSVARKALKTQLQFYLGCLLFPFRILRWGEADAGASATATLPVSGFFSLTVHLILVAALCYFPITRVDTLTPVPASPVHFIAANSTDRRLPLQQHRSRPPRKLVTPNRKGLGMRSDSRAQNLTVQPSVQRHSLPQLLAATHELRSFWEDFRLPPPASPSIEAAPKIPKPFRSSMPSQDVTEFLSTPRAAGHDPPVPNRVRSHTVYRRPTGPPHRTSSLDRARSGDEFATSSQATSAQANLSTISYAFRRLRAIRGVQQWDAYSLAQLRRIARGPGQYPLLISHCRKSQLRTLLKDGWTPIVLLRSPVGGKHLWVLTDWDADAAQITLTNPLEQCGIRLSEADFMKRWLTGNAPSSCLLLSRLPFPEPFPQLLAENRPRVWY